MVHGIYKIVSKVLSNRMKHVIRYLISDSQTAFIAGRQIINGFMIANEVVYDLERSGETGMMFKVDFHRAFDTVL
jgi:hypothetical protein